MKTRVGRALLAIILLFAIAPYNTTTGAFDVTATGTIVGFPGIQFRFQGAIAASGNMTGTVTIGGTGGLPANEPISYTIRTVRS